MFGDDGSDYSVPEDVRSQVLSASEADDVEYAERKKLYAALNRRTTLMPPAVLARWSSDGLANKKKFLFLQEWVSAGCDFGKVTVTEEQKRTATTENRKITRWVTKVDFYSEKGSYDSPEAKEY